MKCDKRHMLLYAVTDRAWTGKRTLYQQVEAALKGGVTCCGRRRWTRRRFSKRPGTSARCAAGTGCLSSSTTMWTLRSPAARTAFMWARRTWRRGKSAAGWERT